LRQKKPSGVEEILIPRVSRRTKIRHKETDH
jgi:hypothetical protein